MADTKQSVRNFCMSRIFDRVEQISTMDYRFYLQIIIVSDPSVREFTYLMLDCELILYI